jgi:putative NADH-flavin reductase
MNIVVFGGTGDVGQEIVSKLIDQDKKVAVLTRQSKQSSDKITYVVGNVLDYNSVETCIENSDQIIIALGFNNSATDTMSKGTQNILNAMKVKNCNRVVCLSAQGVGDSWDYMPREFKEMVTNNPVLDASFKDHSIQEEIIKSSEFEWTIVRPTEIIDSVESKTFTINYPTESSTFQISKYDVAQFIIDQLADNKFSRRTVMITN